MTTFIEGCLVWTKGRVGNAGPNVGVEPQRFRAVTFRLFVAASLRSRDRSLQKDAGSAQRLPGRRLDPCGDAPFVDFFADLDDLLLIRAPALLRISSVAAMISGPMPSP
jgi:hypothetical protein